MPSFRGKAWLFRCLQMITLAVLLDLMVFPAHAADGLERPIQLDIPVNTRMEDALIEWGTKAGMTVMINTQSVESLLTPAVRGTLSARAALALLLRGSGLTYTEEGNRIRIVPASGLARSSLLDHHLAFAENSDMEFHSVTSGESISGGDSGSPAAEESGPSSTSRDLEQVVVTAQKREERLIDVPISISVVDGAKLDQSSLSSVGEALNLIPGVSITGQSGTAIQGGGLQLSIRGVTASSPVLGGSSPIAYYVDSVPFGLARSAVVPDTGSYDLDRVEVLRGPQGTLYGAGGEAGVVRVLTKDADLNNFDFKTRGSISTTDTGGENYRGDMAANIPVVDGVLAARVVVGDEHLSGWINSPVGRHINDGDLTNLRLKIDAQPTNGFSLGLSAWHSESNFGAPSQSLIDRTISVTDPQPTKIYFSAYGAKMNYDFPLFSATSNTSYLTYTSYNEIDLAAPPGIPGVPDGPDTAIYSDIFSRVFSEELLLNSTLSGPWRWTAGLFYRDATERFLQYTGTSLLYPLPLDTSVVSKSDAVFGQITRALMDGKLEVTVGGRYFHDRVWSIENQPEDPSLIGLPLETDRASFTSTTPRAVLTWYPVKDLTLYTSYSQGFRSGFPQPLVTLIAAPGFPPLGPDKLTNYEVGMKGVLLDQRLTFDTAFYYMKWKGVQQSLEVPYRGVGTTAFVNGTGASGPGFEISLSTRPFDGLTLGLEFGWNDLTFDDDVISGGAVLFPKGGRLQNSPQSTAGAQAQYTSILGSSGYRGTFSISQNYIAAQAGSAIYGGPTAPLSSAIWNLRTNIAILSPSGRWTTTVYGDNLGNEHASPFVYPGFPTVLEWSQRVRPRTVGVQLDYHFR
jgi:iron complex outermembrane recepter protein